MLENSFGVSFFLKSSKSQLKFIYLRSTVDGISKETSTKRKVDLSKWNQKTERAIGNNEDARSRNYFLDSLASKINMFRSGMKGILDDNKWITAHLSNILISTRPDY